VTCRVILTNDDVRSFSMSEEAQKGERKWRVDLQYGDQIINRSGFPSQSEAYAWAQTEIDRLKQQPSPAP
jgi:hypothetical protein